MSAPKNTTYWKIHPSLDRLRRKKWYNREKLRAEVGGEFEGDPVEEVINELADTINYALVYKQQGGDPTITGVTIAFINHLYEAWGRTKQIEREENAAMEKALKKYPKLLASISDQFTTMRGDDGDQEYPCEHGVGHSRTGVHTCEGCCAKWKWKGNKRIK